jgi:hypothetical protein
MVTEKERNEIFNLIRSSDDQNKKLGIDLARSLNLEAAEILEMILRFGWLKVDDGVHYRQEIHFLNLSFNILSYYRSTNIKDKSVSLLILLNGKSFLKKEVRFNCLGKNEIFIQQTIQLLIDNINTI